MAFVAMLLALPSLGNAATLLTEDFNAATLGGVLVPANQPNPGDPQQNTTGMAPADPTFFINDYGVIVQDLRGVSGGEALKFRDVLGAKALRATWNLTSGVSTGILDVGFDIKLALDAADSLSGIPVQLSLKSSVVQGVAISFLLLNDSGKMRVFTTDSSTSANTRSTAFGSASDLLVNTTYRIVLNMNLDTSKYGISLYNENGSLYGNTTGLNFVYNSANGPVDTSRFFDFQGGAADFITSPNPLASTSGIILDNILVQSIPEPTSAALLLLAGGGLFLARRRRPSEKI